jgi:hypothetical protein
VAYVKIPELTINARYTSSGVLIILPASGQGSFHSTLGMSHQNTLYIRNRRSVLCCRKDSELYYRTDLFCWHRIHSERLVTHRKRFYGLDLRHVSLGWGENVEIWGHLIYGFNCGKQFK